MKFEICSFIFSSHFLFSLLFVYNIFFTSLDTYQKLLHMYGYVCLFCHIIDSVLGKHINISGNIYSICSQCIKLYMYTVCTLALQLYFKDCSRRPTYSSTSFGQGSKYFITSKATSFKTQIIKIFKLEDLGDSSINNFARYRLQILINI